MQIIIKDCNKIHSINNIAGSVEIQVIPEEGEALLHEDGRHFMFYRLAISDCKKYQQKDEIRILMDE